VVLRQVGSRIAASFKHVGLDLSADVLFAAVQKSRGLISGSSVLWCLDPATHWRARDLDVFVPTRRAAKKFVAFLKSLSSLSVSEVDPKRKRRAGKLHNYPGAFQVSDFSVRPVLYDPLPERQYPPCLRVQVTVVLCNDVVSHVAGFDLAFLRNWTDGRRLVVGDVSAVCKRRSPVNKPVLPRRFLRWLGEYAWRGYKFTNLRMQPKLLRHQVEVGSTGVRLQVEVRVFLMLLSGKCVGVFFNRDEPEFEETVLKLVPGIPYVRQYLRCVCAEVKPAFRSFVAVDALVTHKAYAQIRPRFVQLKEAAMKLN
jgi:hypothetical protein